MRGPFVVKKIENGISSLTDQMRISWDVYKYTNGRQISGHALIADCPRKDIAEFVRDALNAQWKRGIRYTSAR